MSGIAVELELNDEGYRRLSIIAERLSRDLPAFGLADALTLVIEAGTAVVEDRLQASPSTLLLPSARN